MQPTIQVQGLKEFARALRRVDAAAAKQIRIVNNDAAGLVVDRARPKIPARTGRARASLRLRSTRTLVRVAAGGDRAPWYPWLDWGGRTGPGKSVRRPFIQEGRYLYPTLREVSGEVRSAMEDGLARIAREAGLEVDRG